MSNIIESLREKSEGARRMIAVGVSFALTLVIGFVWISTTFPGVVPGSPAVAQSGSANSKSQTAQVLQVQETGPLKAFGQNVAQSFSAVKDQWDSISTYFSETSYDAGNELQDLETLSPEEAEAEQKTTTF
jgi:hypothetical protein